MALPDNITIPAGTSRTSGIAAASVASGANYLGSEIDNASNGDDAADIQITYSFGTNPTASKSMRLYLLWAFDGTNYQEGAGDGTGTGDVDPLATHTLLRSWSPTADTGTHRIVVGDFPLLKKKFKLLVLNVDTGQTATVTVLIETKKAGQQTD